MIYVTLDFETFYDKGYSLKSMTYEQYIRDERFHVHCVGIKIDNEPVETFFGDEIKNQLNGLFAEDRDEPITMICHNTLFDGAVLHWFYGLKADRYLCTQAMSRAIWNQRKADLEHVALSCFPDDPTRRKGTELKAFKGKATLTAKEEQVLGDYCGNDVELTFACFAYMYRYFPKDELEILDLTLKMFIEPAFVLDRPRLEAFLVKIKQEKAALIKASGVAKTVLSSNEKFAAWILAQGIPLTKIPSPTEDDPNNMKWPLAKDSLEFLALQRNYPQHKAVWDARIAAKSTIDETRANRMLDHAQVSHINPDGLLAMPLNYAAAHTLRWGGTNKMNPQNYRRGSEMRKALTAPDGYMVLVHDLAGIEHRKNAWFSGETWMLEAFKQKRDLYMEFATRMFGYPVTDKKKQERERFVGKVGELQLMYQSGWFGFQTSLAKGALGGPPVHLSDQEAKDAVKEYRNSHPKIRKNWALLDSMLLRMCDKTTDIEYKCLRFQHQRVRLPNGMYLNYPELKATPRADRDGYEFSYFNGKFTTNIYGGKFTENIIQALSRITIAHHLLLAARYLAKIGGRIVLTVHDELVSIVPARFAEEARSMIDSILRKPPPYCDDGSLVLDVESSCDVCYSK